MADELTLLRLADLERDAYKLKDIRPRVLDVLEEFGVVRFSLMDAADKAAVLAFRKTGKS